MAVKRIKSLSSRCRQASVHDAPENAQKRHGGQRTQLCMHLTETPPDSSLKACPVIRILITITIMTIIIITIIIITIIIIIIIIENSLSSS